MPIRQCSVTVVTALLMFLFTGCYGTIHVERASSKSEQSLDMASVERGRKTYQNHCQACHGAKARGKGPKAEQFDPPPTDLIEPGWHVTTTGLEAIVDFPHYSSEAMRRRIRHGATDMPGFKESFSQQEITDIVSYITFLSQQRQGEKH